MAVITPTNKEVTSFKGLHLYHHGLSQCSQRVRIRSESEFAWKRKAFLGKASTLI